MNVWAQIGQMFGAFALSSPGKALRDVGTQLRVDALAEISGS